MTPNTANALTGKMSCPKFTASLGFSNAAELMQSTGSRFEIDMIPASQTHPSVFIQKAVEEDAPRDILGYCMPCLSGVLSGAAVGVQRTASALLSKHRSREMRFYHEHPEAFSDLIGHWVVLEGESIAAQGTDPVSVVSEARKKGIPVPFIFRVEPKRGKSEGTIGL